MDTHDLVILCIPKLGDDMHMRLGETTEFSIPATSLRVRTQVWAEY